MDVAGPSSGSAWLVVRLVLRRVAMLVGLGIALGIGLGILAGATAAKFISGMLYGLQPKDPLTFAAAMVGALAGWIPARRASRVDPAFVLRQ